MRLGTGGGEGKPVGSGRGGRGTLEVTHKGKKDYVCCTGCRDAFKEDPETYIKEFEAKQAKKK